jgi:hypothetical protein
MAPVISCITPSSCSSLVEAPRGASVAGPDPEPLGEQVLRPGPCDNDAAGEDEMRRSTLLIWLSMLGAALWLSSRVVETQPTFALLVGLAVLLFAAFAADRPLRG